MCNNMTKKKTKPLKSCIKHIQIGTKMSINLHNSNQMVLSMVCDFICGYALLMEKCTLCAK